MSWAPTGKGGRASCGASSHAERDLPASHLAGGPAAPVLAQRCPNMWVNLTSGPQFSIYRPRVRLDHLGSHSDLKQNNLESCNSGHCA